MTDYSRVYAIQAGDYGGQFESQWLAIRASMADDSDWLWLAIYRNNWRPGR